MSFFISNQSETWYNVNTLYRGEMMDQLELLKNVLKSYQKVAIAYSGGCDSHFLYTVAKETLGVDNVLAVLCVGEMMSREDIDSAKALLQGGQYEIIPIDVLQIDAFCMNRKDRCYFCKKEIMSRVISKAKEKGYTNVLDGMNKDDLSVYRPGRKACEELGILSPLKDMTKQMIRRYSKQFNIVTYNKPANACLASRFPYDTKLTLEKLERVARGEALFHRLGIDHMRLRVHDDLARIEIEKKDFMKVIENQTLLTELKALGFRFVTLDLEGIKSGSYD